jgi:hypothetical protein
VSNLYFKVFVNIFILKKENIRKKTKILSNIAITNEQYVDHYLCITHGYKLFQNTYGHMFIIRILIK